MIKNNSHNQLKNAIWGFITGDALGVPYEFRSREAMDASPATDMIGYGTHDQPPGTWSDDTSLMLCLMDSLSRGYDLQDLANRFINWYRHGYWTPHGEVFDIGIATREAILRMERGLHPTACGGKGEYDNGNGALMRILPMAFFLLNEEDQQIRLQKVKEVASLTHGHDISHIGCFIYTEVIRRLILGQSWKEAIESLHGLRGFLQAEGLQEKHLQYYDSLFASTFRQKKREEIHSSGFVVHTLEASLWCISQTINYRDAVLAAVNLGDDTDTTAAVTGGLACLIRGINEIQEAWMDQIPKQYEIKHLIGNFTWVIL